MSNYLKIFLVFVLCCVALGGCGVLWGISQYNGFVTMHENIDGAWAQVDNQLKRRNDLIPNLVNTVKGYATHEKEIFIQIAEARSKLAGARTPSDKIAAAQEMDGTLGRLLVVVEQYPNLKANESFNKLMDELAGTENRLATERMRYNERVKIFNTDRQRFPGSIIAGFFHFEESRYYEVPESEKKNPVVNFN